MQNPKNNEKQVMLVGVILTMFIYMFTTGNVGGSFMGGVITWILIMWLNRS